MKIELRPKSTLPLTDVSWVSMTDHFVATVGAAAGQGKPWQNVLVLADATFAPHARFPMHDHQDMEIVSLVLAGTLTHHEPTTSLNIAEHAAQIMSAHQGMSHAEGNETDTPVRMLQIWIRPRANTLKPIAGTHEVLGPFEKVREWMQVTPASLRQSAAVKVAHVPSEQSIELRIADGKGGYLLCAGGPVTIGGGGTTVTLQDGDGAFVSAGNANVVAHHNKATLVLIEQ